MSERRRAPRIQVSLEITQINGEKVASSRVLDLSELGAKLETSLSLAPGDPLEFTFVLEGGQEASRRGRVVWVLPLTATPGLCRLGVEFFQAFPVMV
jgi:hypothetical protein